MESGPLLLAHWIRCFCFRHTHGPNTVLSQRHRCRPARRCHELDLRCIRRSDAIGVHLVGCVCTKVVQGPEGQHRTHDAWRGAADP